MGLIRLIYASQPFGYDESTIYGILIDARAHNARAGITGALVCRADLYLQCLEGEREMVEALYGRIEADDRHVEVRRLANAPATERLFPDWAMRHDPPRSWMWSQAEVARGAIETATAAEAEGAFRRLALEPA